MYKKLLSLILTFVFVFSLPVYPTYSADGGQDLISLASPDGSVVLNFSLENGSVYYSLSVSGFTAVEKSLVGLESDIGDFSKDFTYKSHEITKKSDSFSPIAGDNKSYDFKYSELNLVLNHKSGYEFLLNARAYDGGAAFRYILPKTGKVYKLTGEKTKITFPDDENIFAAAHEKSNQSIPQKVFVNNFKSGALYQRPMTIKYPNGYVMTIAEAKNINYSAYALTSLKPFELSFVYQEGLSSAGAPKSESYNIISDETTYETPYRVFVTGKSESELLQNAPVIESLNDAPDEDTYAFSSWVKPGSCLRAATGMNSAAIKKIVDQASTHGFKYVLLDTGWYGPEYDTNCDPRLDPLKLDMSNDTDKLLKEIYFGKDGEGKYKTGEGIFRSGPEGINSYKKLGEGGGNVIDVDIPDICDYANAKNIGIILYVNGLFFPDASGRNRFNADELFSYFEKWGVKGVKPGFVSCRTQQYETEVQNVIRAAAKHKLVMTIHDEFVPAGIERTFPNLLTAEGILGDEAIGRYKDNDGNTPTQTEYDITTLFTRTIQSPADHTFCYPGKATKAYAVASPLMFRTGLNLLYWYTNPNSIAKNDVNRIKILDNLPATWEKTLYLEAKMYEYATFARKAESGEWYIGSLSANERDLKVSLDFLDDNQKYRIDIYKDGKDADANAGWNSKEKEAQTLLVNSYIADKNTVIESKILKSGGFSAKLTPASDTDLEKLLCYTKELDESQTEPEKQIFVKFDLNYLTFTDVSPFIENNRTLVPFRVIFEALGADVSWDDETKTATAVKAGTTIKLTANSNTVYINSQKTDSDVCPMIVSNRFVVPIRLISEALGYAVYYDAEASCVVIRTVKKQTLPEGALEIKDCFFNAYYDGNDEIGQFSYDGDTSTVWSCEGENKFICYDLGEAHDIDKVSVMWNKGNIRKQYFKVYVSDDGENFTSVFVGESAGNVENGYEDTAVNKRARFVKIECNKTSAGSWNAIKEILIFGK